MGALLTIPPQGGHRQGTPSGIFISNMTSPSSCSPVSSPPSSPPGMHAPLGGTGFFLNSGDTKSLAHSSRTQEGLAILRESRARWAGLWIESPDKRRPNLSDLIEGHRHLQREGVRTVLWTFPGAESLGDLERSSSWIGECYDALTRESPGPLGAGPAGGVTVILDIELDFKGKAPLSKKFEALLQALRASRPGLVFGFTSYPFGHPTLPWGAFQSLLTPGVSPVMPQLYVSGGDARSISRAWAHYGKKFPGCPIVPVVASYIEDSRRLRTSLELIVPTHKPSSLGVWVLKTTDSQEAQVLASFENRLGNGEIPLRGK